MTNLAIKLDLLRRIIRSYQSCLIAYSGGIDSALVLFIAHEQLAERAVACIGLSPSYPQREKNAAIAFADSIGAKYRLIEPREYLNDNYIANNSDRCYHCKSALFDGLKQIARDEHWHTIADGTHLDDIGDHIHGMRAANERNIRSPLLEASLRKDDIRQLARMLNLSLSEKPAVACLASRIPHGTAVTPELLAQIEAAEDALASIGLHQFRVRHHGDLARIEVPENEMPQILAHRTEIVRSLHTAGYKHVVLDLLAFHEVDHLVPLNLPAACLQRAPSSCGFAPVPPADSPYIATIANTDTHSH